MTKAEAYDEGYREGFKDGLSFAARLMETTDPKEKEDLLSEYMEKQRGEK